MKSRVVAVLLIAVLAVLPVFPLGNSFSALKPDALAEDLNSGRTDDQGALSGETAFDYDYLRPAAVYENRTIRGVRFEWNKDQSACTAVGTAANQWAYTQLYFNADRLPAGMKAGKTYRVRCRTTNENLRLSIGTFLDGRKTAAEVACFTENGQYQIPANATGMFIRIEVEDGATVDDTISDIAILSDLSRDELSEKLETIDAQQERIISDMNILKANNSFDWLRAFAVYENTVTYGVTFVWNESKTVCRATGTAEDPLAFTNLFYNDEGLPEGIVPGKTYRITCKTTNASLSLMIGAFLNGAKTKPLTEQFIQDGTYTVPSDATGMFIRVAVPMNATVDDSISDLSIVSEPGTDVLAALAEEQTDYYGKDFLKLYGKFEDTTVNGVTYRWNPGKWVINGTAADTASYYFYDGALPKGMNPGDEFLISLQKEYEYLGAEYRFYDSDQILLQSGRTPDSTSFSFKVPQNAARWTFRVYLSKGRQADNVRVESIKVIKLRPMAMDVPLIVSFVDDDTTNEDYVRKFHDACSHNGVKGTFAVVTQKIESGAVALDTLLEYENEGFGMCVHCYQQGGAEEWRILPRTGSSVTACRTNLAKALRQMRQYGFVNYNYWITPFGYKDAYMRQIAQELGLECLISINNYRHNTTRDADRWMIRRVQLKYNDEKSYATMALVKAAIDAAAADGGGWLIITTHFNEGWKTLDWDTTPDENGYPVGYARFNEMVQYALNAGMVPMTVQQAWQYYEPVLNANQEACYMSNAE